MSVGSPLAERLEDLPTGTPLIGADGQTGFEETDEERIF